MPKIPQKASAQTGAATSAKTPRPQFHGVLRGLDSTLESPMFEGRFGRMFRTLPAAKFFVEDLDALAAEMVATPEEEPTPETEIDAEESSVISAGFTYLGQFIDHDITFDPTSSLQRQNDPNALTNFRTPRFDLDNVYGRGPADQPYLYEDDGRHFKLGRRLTGAERFDKNTRDLPRHKSEINPETGRARALIGDPRNDENVIVAQLHAVMLRFHNYMADLLGEKASFEEIQQQVRWHYQWVVLFDFLPTIVGWDTIYNVLPHLKTKKSIQDVRPDLRFYKWRNEPFIPVEFSVAAYRFGHSMVRPVYRLNTKFGVDPPAEADKINGRQFIFTPTDTNQGLNGFRKIPENFAIDWRLYFDLNIENQPKTGVERIQPAYKIDSSLVNPLAKLPEFVKKKNRFASLAQRNLRRGNTMGLPSGQDIARFMNLEPLKDSQLKVGKATQEDSKKKNKSIDKISAAFAGKAPLWFYILSEAQQAYNAPKIDDSTPTLLGDVGGRIVAEVFIGLLLGDSHSFLSQAPGWKPELRNSKGQFGMAELIKQSITA